MDRTVLDAIGQQLQLPLHSWHPVSGGDISSAYVLMGDNEKVICKTNPGSGSLNMFRAEVDGLKAIAKSGAIKTPEVLLCESMGSTNVLVLEYIDARNPGPSEMEVFGAQLAQLHLLPQDSFGWPGDNYIGSLPQSNHAEESWHIFYLQQRLLPQLNLAIKNRLMAPEEVPESEGMQQMLERYCKGVSPSLLHGDLWSGNYLISTDGTPYLIDPAVYRGHSEVDLAMSRLFGGFTAAFYESYHELIPYSDGHEERKDLYQLYYLLVHLNLFGKSYYSSVKQLMQRYFPS